MLCLFLKINPELWFAFRAREGIWHQAGGKHEIGKCSHVLPHHNSYLLNYLRPPVEVFEVIESNLQIEAICK